MILKKALNAVCIVAFALHLSSCNHSRHDETHNERPSATPPNIDDHRAIDQMIKKGGEDRMAAMETLKNFPTSAAVRQFFYFVKAIALEQRHYNVLESQSNQTNPINLTGNKLRTDAADAISQSAALYIGAVNGDEEIIERVKNLSDSPSEFDKGIASDAMRWIRFHGTAGNLKLDPQLYFTGTLPFDEFSAKIKRAFSSKDAKDQTRAAIQIVSNLERQDNFLPDTIAALYKLLFEFLWIANTDRESESYHVQIHALDVAFLLGGQASRSYLEEVVKSAREPFASEAEDRLSRFDRYHQAP